MDEYFNEILSSIYEIADNSSEHFFEWYDKIVKAIQNGLSQIDIDMEQFCIYPIGEYDCGTNLEELVPFKVVLEYTCEKSKIIQRIK